jgi:F0F1-type ATP synthase assembly protein I
VQSLFDDENDERPAEEEPVVLASYTPETAGETARRTALAWAAGIAFFGAIIVMLFIGWLVDLSIGTSPWGIVGGIIIGSIVGFLQFFHISSKIFGYRPSGPSEHPILPKSETPERTDRFDEP